MKKLSILHTESSTGWGGQEIRVLTEAVELKKRGCRVIIACQSGSQLSKRCRDAEIKAVEIGMNRSFSPSACFKIYKLIKQERVDIVNTHSSNDSWIASAAAKMAGIKIVRTRHIDVPISNNPLNFIYRLPDKIITTSEAIKIRLIGNGVQEGKIHCIPTGVDLCRFRPAAGREDLKRELGILNRYPVVTNVAVLRSWKGHSFLFRAVSDVIKYFSDAVFLIVGDGHQREALEGLIDELNIKSSVIMTGHRDDVQDILNITDLFVLSSTKYEGIPQALLQAMAANVPIVSTNVDGVKDIIKDMETGIIAEPSNPGSLSEKILYALRNIDNIRTMADKSRRLAEGYYSLDKMVDRLEELYGELTAIK
ncbi:MAG: glycosyltransferase family 4 protein [Deltaproteobacteria bacterium]|nr:glycosyltransferase family 4 protein [Deltaproteobacteria bacterium]